MRREPITKEQLSNDNLYWLITGDVENMSLKISASQDTLFSRSGAWNHRSVTDDSGKSFITDGSI